MGKLYAWVFISLLSWLLMLPALFDHPVDDLNGNKDTIIILPGILWVVISIVSVGAVVYQKSIMKTTLNIAYIWLVVHLIIVFIFGNVYFYTASNDLLEIDRDVWSYSDKVESGTSTLYIIANWNLLVSYVFTIKVINESFNSKSKLEIYAVSTESYQVNPESQEDTEQKLQDLFRLEGDTTEIQEHPPSPIVILE